MPIVPVIMAAGVGAAAASKDENKNGDYYGLANKSIRTCMYMVTSGTCGFSDITELEVQNAELPW